MLAGVNVITMGAGIPLQIPSVLNAYASGRAAIYRTTVTGSAEGSALAQFDPKMFFDEPLPQLKKPDFLPIVSSDALASIMVKKLPGEISGFVVEGPTAGGHNAPPRGRVEYNELGEPIYGPRDRADCEKLRALGLPFWLAGSHASPAGLAEAQRLGAVGIQAGSIFALSSDSGMDAAIKQEIIRRYYNGTLSIRTDALASPTGFPFKVVQLPGTMSELPVFEERTRICNKKGLIVPHQMPDGKIVYRCSAEPITDYLKKEGMLGDAEHSACLCNGLLTTAGFGDNVEAPIVTLGDDVSFLEHLTDGPEDSYTAAEALNWLLGRPGS
jgi:nitronate monooxygenase